MEEIVFQDSRDDWAYVQRYVHFRDLWRWLYLGLSWAGLLIGICCILSHPKNGAGWIIATLSVLLLRLIFDKGYTLEARGEIRITLDDEKLRCQIPGADCTFTQLERVVRTKRLLMIYESPYAIMVLPFRACADAAQYERFEQLARGLIKK